MFLKGRTTPKEITEEGKTCIFDPRCNSAALFFNLITTPRRPIRLFELIKARLVKSILLLRAFGGSCTVAGLSGRIVRII